MQAYATAERVRQRPKLRSLPSISESSSTESDDSFNDLVIDELLGRLADLIADRVAARVAAASDPGDGWLDTRRAADYLGVHRDTIRRLAAEGVLPAQQSGVGCKLYFRRDDLENWRRSDRTPVASTALAGRSR